jgi:hypothetical protein
MGVVNGGSGGGGGAGGDGGKAGGGGAGFRSKRKKTAAAKRARVAVTTTQNPPGGDADGDCGGGGGGDGGGGMVMGGGSPEPSSASEPISSVLKSSSVPISSRARRPWRQPGRARRRHRAGRGCWLPRMRGGPGKAPRGPAFWARGGKARCAGRGRKNRGPVGPLGVQSPKVALAAAFSASHSAACARENATFGLD